MNATRLLGTIAALSALLAVPAAAAVHDPVISSNQPLPFPQNAQNEPALAISRTPGLPGPLLVAGGNDYRDQPKCSTAANASCGFQNGVGISGVYYSDDGIGWSAPVTGLKTIPNFTQSRWSFGDPALTSGPRLRKGFAWANGTRFYYATLAATPPPAATTAAPPPDRLITVSWSDPTQRARIAFPHWSKPLPISGTSPSSDKPAIWADDAANVANKKPNPNFGHVYACWTAFPSDAAAESDLGGQIMFTRSVNGGRNWSKPVQLSVTVPNAAHACAIRSDSHGTVYVFWKERLLGVKSLDLVGTGAACAKVFRSNVWMARSTNGLTFTRPTPLFPVAEAGQWDKAQGACTADGPAGARTNSFVSVDIANGAPFGIGPNTFALVTAEGPNGTVLLRTSHTLGTTWSAPIAVSRPNDVGAFPAVALAPHGAALFVVYQAFLIKTWQSSAIAGPRPMQAVLRTTSLRKLEADPTAAAWGEVDGSQGDARASSGFEGGDKPDAKPIAAEFLGDYDAIVATDRVARAAWTDVSAAQDCGPVDSYRYAVSSGSDKSKPPDVQACPMEKSGHVTKSFGNTTLCGASIPAGFTQVAPETLCASTP